jgi:hypothetical protein
MLSPFFRKAFPQFVLLALVGLVGSGCGAEESEMEVSRVLHAERYTFLKYGNEKDRPQTGELKGYIGSADPEVLKRLENLFFATPRVSSLVYYLESEAHPVVCGCRESEWIRCTLRDGQVFCIQIRHEGETISVYGEPDLGLSLSEEESSAIFDKTGWAEGNASVPNPGSELDKSSLLVGEASVAGISLESSLTYGSEDNPTKLVSAGLTLVNSEGPSQPHLMGRATNENLARLEEWLFGGRTSTLRHMPSGEIFRWNEGEEPIAIIQCKMSDGQEILLHAFSPDYRLSVSGEGDFCLRVEPKKVKEFLESDGWEVPK